MSGAANEARAQIFQAPTLTNPHAIDDIGELRQELNRANILLLQQFDQLMTYNAIIRQMGQSLSAIMLAHMGRDSEKLLQVLNAIQAKHVRETAPGTGTLQ